MKQLKKHTGSTVFYSYASADKALRDQLANHLSQLKRDGLISEWHDQQIPAGSPYAQTIGQAIHSAHIILLLISADFLASDTHYQIEMQLALERHKQGEACVIPILVRPCDWQHSPFEHLQCLPRNKKPITTWDNLDEAFISIAQELRKIIIQQQFPILALSSIQRQNRERLLKRVRATWIKDLLEHSLHRDARIDLYLQEQPDALENPWRLEMQELDHAPYPLPVGTSIVEVYDEADGELLILGKPGAGKTTLLLELTRTLLDRAEKDERLCMPVVFNLSSWANKRQPLRLWLQEELWTKYQVPRKIGQDWIDTAQVLPLLDGLDEVAKDARIACVQQINTYYQYRLERGESPIVVCCRSEEYATLSTLVVLQRAVSILPLTDEQINTYLEQAGEQVIGLKQVLNEDAELHSLIRQPLMLNLFTIAYQGATSAEVPTGETQEEIQQTLFARYVERMLKRRVPSKRWKREHVLHWLTFLAKQMQQHDQTVFSVENLQPIWLSRRGRILYQLCVGLFGGVVIGLLFGLFIGLGFGLFIGLTDGLSFGLFIGLGLGLLFGMLFGSDTEINPAEALTWSWRKARSGLVVGLVSGVIGWLVGWLVVGLAIGLLFGLDTEINPTKSLTWSWRKARSGLVIGLVSGVVGWLVSDLIARLVGWITGWLIIGLVSGLAGGLLFGLSGRQFLERSSLSPNEGIWRSGKNGLVIGLLVGLICGLLFGPIGGLVGSLIGGLLIGLVVGLARGLDAFVRHFILRFFILRQGDLPWDLAAFLDEEAGRLLLRKVGGSYIFVHRQLLDYFAAIENSMLSASTSSEDKIDEA